MTYINNKLLIVLLTLPLSIWAELPKNFSYVQEKNPTVELDIRYYSNNNFIGRKIDGYLAAKAILTNQANIALGKVQKELKVFGLGLKIFDAYRPQKAVDHFVRWGLDLEALKMKALYYPNVKKKNLFKEGYIAKKSGHSRGSTVDLTIIDLGTKEALDMGSSFDFFGIISHVKSKSITFEQRSNRMLLNSLMLKYGFKAYAQEWWHFTLKDEPYKKTYFNFNVK